VLRWSRVISSYPACVITGAWDLHCHAWEFKGRDFLGTSVSGPNLNGISLIKGVFMTCRIVSVYFFADEQSLSKYAPYAVMEAAIPATRAWIRR
jgi:hypothetical protein